MKTTMNIPDELLKTAIAVSGSRTKTEAVLKGLEELIRQKRIERIFAQAGKLDFEAQDDARHGR